MFVLLGSPHRLFWPPCPHRKQAGKWPLACHELAPRLGEVGFTGWPWERAVNVRSAETLRRDKRGRASHRNSVYVGCDRGSKRRCTRDRGGHGRHPTGVEKVAAAVRALCEAQFESRLVIFFRVPLGGTVRRTATSREPSKTSRTWLQVKQRNSPLSPGLDINSMRR